MTAGPASEPILHCLLCGGREMTEVVNLGEQPLSSVFPVIGEPDPPSAPLRLGQCSDASCGCVQLLDKAKMSDMYGFDYGYNSSLSPFMIEHLRQIYQRALVLRPLSPDDLVVDIGCNDGTLLAMFGQHTDALLGVDPSSARFRSRFPGTAEVVIDFFPSQSFDTVLRTRKASIVTSIAMFYDLDRPHDFARRVHDILVDDGIWVVELAELTEFLKNLSYDQICHEHLLYLDEYSMITLAESVGFSLREITYSEINGGSACYFFSKTSGPEARRSSASRVSGQTLHQLSSRIALNRSEVRAFLESARAHDKSVWGYGASTKGNVLQNYYGITRTDIPYISDINPYKKGRRTPGSGIPIVDRETFRAERPDYALCFIWHLRAEVLRDEREYILGGGSLVFPLPRLHVIDATNVDLYEGRPLNDLAFDISQRQLTV